MMYAKEKFKNISDKASPCFRPFRTGNKSDLYEIYYRFHLHILLITITNFIYSIRILYNTSHITES
jgi:hypothetical protein